MKTITALVVRAVGFCAQNAWPVVGLSILLAIASTWYAATHFAMTTDVNQLISSKMEWRQREARSIHTAPGSSFQCSTEPPG